MYLPHWALLLAKIICRYFDKWFCSFVLCHTLRREMATRELLIQLHWTMDVAGEMKTQKHIRFFFFQITIKFCFIFLLIIYSCYFGLI